MRCPRCWRGEIKMLRNTDGVRRWHHTCPVCDYYRGAERLGDGDGVFPWWFPIALPFIIVLTWAQDLWAWTKALFGRGK